ncbi:MAG: hypothetical protein US40_C0001G0041 [Candidatus Roizmanbacteria bacterium GW2011_GWC2_37_13]|uniref:Glycosyltransferase RgtA/B/C/D-like domain-containing protein n=1 Tax=Candidatus Roizmanbacteria bacterium GW2011_GWC2_37_13 TaxID=1618486 RepID=A0A0G0G9P3_9BACT|nr:MAG: hypothetical protein US38_C0002G0041 [Candidatus Roizmanbacteria bacterium GW2011_GWC1_37_12]KKQ26692.1 MAG: hypothetical protein US40_C0001G0041 [Candidatus Roizmanbacteria bacterium GW2011_GWC2_37_13]
MLFKKRKTFFIIILFIIISLVFNSSLWNSLLTNSSTIGSSADKILAVWGIENIYQKLINFKNPFVINNILYPFTLNTALSDPGIAWGVIFIFVRPFMNPVKSVIFIVLIYLFLNNLVIYLLFIKKRFGVFLSFLLSLVFGYSPFLTNLLSEHYSYTPIFFFPLTYLVIDQFISSENRKKPFLSAVFGLLLSFIVMTNFYYFFTIVVALLFIIVYLAISKTKKFFDFFLNNIKYFILSFLTFFIILLPWIVNVYTLTRFSSEKKIRSFYGAINLSADLFNFVMPSKYNPFYETFFARTTNLNPIFSKLNNFYLNSWDRFVYPGALIALMHIFILYLLIKKKFDKTLWNKIKLLYYTSIFFAILMLGPFLKIFNRWYINLDGVAVVIPLPFLLLRYIPGLGNLRAPARFAPAFIFFSSIILAYLLNYWFKKINNKKRILAFILLFLIFIFDQYYRLPRQQNSFYPKIIYQAVKEKPAGTVLEIPFTVRDGLKYVGFVHAIQPMAGQLIHGKPIIGGYIARVPNEVFEGYSKTKFISYLAKIIDKGNYNPLKEKPGETNLFPFSYPKEVATKELNNFNIRYIILKTDEKYSNYLRELFEQSGFVEKQKDANYLLLEN